MRGHPINVRLAQLGRKQTELLKCLKEEKGIACSQQEICLFKKGLQTEKAIRVLKATDEILSQWEQQALEEDGGY